MCQWHTQKWSSSIGKELWERHCSAPNDVNKNFTALKKCKNKFNIFLYFLLVLHTQKIISCLYSMLISYSYQLLDNEQGCGQNVVSYPLFLFLNVLKGLQKEIQLLTNILVTHTAFLFLENLPFFKVKESFIPSVECGFKRRFNFSK